MNRLTTLALLTGVTLGGIIAYLHWPWRRRYPAPASFIIEPTWQGQRYPLAERAIAIDGVFNVRDLGGYPTQDGRHVRSGLVYRSGHLSHLTSAGMAVWQTRDLRLICDLRTMEEVRNQPDRVPSGVQHQHLPVYDQNPSIAFNLRTMLAYRGRMDEYFQEGYLLFINDHAPAFAAVLRQLAEPGNLPAVLHCTAGKDRAGLTVALLLAILGVPQDLIIADYTQSNHAFPQIRDDIAPMIAPLRWLGITVADLQPLFTADPQNLRVVFAHIAATWGSVEVYLTQAGGLEKAVIERLRAVLLTT